MVSKYWQTLAWILCLQKCSTAPVQNNQYFISYGEKSFVKSLFDSDDQKQLHYNLNFTEISFNDTSKPTKPLTTYFPLKFTAFEAYNVTLAIEQDLISANDSNCIVAGSNAIFTVPGEHPSPSRFDFDTDAVKSSNISEYFDLVGITLKPLGPAPRKVVADVSAWRVHDGEPLHVYNGGAFWGEGGYLSPIPADFGRYFPGWGKDVNMVEITGRSVEDNKPWPLCIGRIELYMKEAEVPSKTLSH